MTNPDSRELARKLFLRMSLERVAYSEDQQMQNLQEVSQGFVLPRLNLDTPYVIMGAHAANHYQAPRHTEDVDVLVEEENYPAICAELTAQGYRFELELQVRDCFVEMYGARYVKNTGENRIIDVITCSHEWVERAIAAAVRDRGGNLVLSIPFLVLSKIKGRTKDMSDLSMILGYAQGDTLAKTKDLLRTYAPDALDDLASLVFIGKAYSGR